MESAYAWTWGLGSRVEAVSARGAQCLLTLTYICAWTEVGGQQQDQPPHLGRGTGAPGELESKGLKKEHGPRPSLQRHRKSPQKAAPTC